MQQPDPAAPGGNFTPEAAAEHTRRVNACLKAFGDMPIELIEDMQGDMAELMAATEEEVQQLTNQRDELLALLRRVRRWLIDESQDHKDHVLREVTAAITKMEGLL